VSWPGSAHARVPSTRRSAPRLTLLRQSLARSDTRGTKDQEPRELPARPADSLVAGPGRETMWSLFGAIAGRSHLRSRKFVAVAPIDHEFAPSRRAQLALAPLDSPQARCHTCITTMNAVLTARLPASLMKRLRERARRAGTTPSRIVRALLDEELGPTSEDRPVLELTRSWVGAVRDRRVPAGRNARSALKRWSPDRRG
jgi:hypothetical protein